MAWASLIRNVVIFVAVFTVGNAQNCVPRDFGYGSTVCVCNATYCDSVGVVVPSKGQFRVYESGKSGKRMSQQVGTFNVNPRDDVLTIALSLSPNQTFQKIHGFGGSFTDAAGINIRNLSLATQAQIIQTYYGENGARYTLGRVPIAGSDFSTRAYTYDDHSGDLKLRRWALANEDYEYKIPFMRKALATNPNLRFLASSWSAPAWMKTNKQLTGSGYLDPAYYQIYADYVLKFLNAYREHGLPMWAMTTGNEPNDALIPAIDFQKMGWVPSTEADWVGNNLGPTLAKSESNYTLILSMDDQRINLPWYPRAVFEHPLADKYVAGIAIHWYFDQMSSPKLLDTTHDLFPNKFMLLTEACIDRLVVSTGPGSGGPAVRLGDWFAAEKYIEDIMENMNHHVAGWIDWNLVLDKQGGPNWVENFVDSPIIVNPETDEFFKQPMYYALAHFSKFVEPGSTRIGITTSSTVQTTAFLTTKNETVIILYNGSDNPVSVTVADPEQGNARTEIPGKSIQTIIYQR